MVMVYHHIAALHSEQPFGTVIQLYIIYYNDVISSHDLRLPGMEIWPRERSNWREKFQSPKGGWVIWPIPRNFSKIKIFRYLTIRTKIMIFLITKRLYLLIYKKNYGSKNHQTLVATLGTRALCGKSRTVTPDNKKVI